MLEINIFASLLIISIFLLLFFRKNNAFPNKVLAFVFLTPGLNFINNVHILSEGIYHFPWTYFLVQVTAVLFAPLSYFYINLITGMRHPKWYKWLAGISLLIVFYGIFIGVRFAAMAQPEQQIYMKGVMEGPYPLDMLIYSGIFFLHQLFYFSLNVKEVWQYRKEMMQQVSSLTAVKVTYLIRFTALLWLLTFITILLYATIDAVYVEYVHLPLVMVIIFFFILYYAFNQHAVFTLGGYRKHLEDMAFSVNPYGKDMEIQDDLFTQIKNTVHEQELYKNPEISLQSVGAVIDKPIYQIAAAIKNSGTSFYEMIRQIRVEKAKELLADKNCNYTIEAIAYEVGFNSRASFYRAFKKYELKDPSSLIDVDNQNCN